MEIVTTLLTGLAPFAVLWLTNIFKEKQRLFTLYADNRKALIRSFVALVATLAGIALAFIDGENITSGMIEAVMNAFIFFLASTGLYKLTNN